MPRVRTSCAASRGFFYSHGPMNDDAKTIAAMLLCLCPWLAVLVAVKLFCEVMR